MNCIFCNFKKEIRMKTSKGTIAVLLAVVLSVSCGERRRLRTELTDFRKSEIEFPGDMEVCNAGNFAMADALDDDMFRQIVYYDSTECTGCRLSRLMELAPLYELAARDGRFEVVTIFSPKEDEVETVRVQLLVQDVGFPVYVDTYGSFSRLNGEIPPDTRFHSFLIDGNGHPVMVGNPAESDAMKEILLEILDNAETAN